LVHPASGASRLWGGVWPLLGVRVPELGSRDAPGRRHRVG